MRREIIDRFESQRVPRYTSYPTAPHFTQPIDAATYRRWLAAIPEDAVLSLYLHIPFCRTLCWYCGCHTRIVDAYEPIAAYLAALEQEIRLVADALPRRATVGHIHWGGGTPTILAPDSFAGLMGLLRERFVVAPDAEIAVEIDPRRMNRARIDALAESGVTRASLGVQSFDPEVQRAINRVQSVAETAEVTEALRAAGIRDVNFDLIYGLPHQTAASCAATVDEAVRLAPDRLAVFGYAHVPWMRKHQQKIDTATLPDAAARLDQFTTITERLEAAGYRPIGLDHFAKPDDSLSRCLDQGRLRRNFQGYTADQCSVLLGFGASALGLLPGGYLQNVSQIGEYRRLLAADALPVQRGRRLSDDDRRRAAVIERIMCDLAVDLDAIAATHGDDPGGFAGELARLDELESSGVVRRDGRRIVVAAECRPLARIVAAAFDAYLEPAGERHSRAI
jgi:oxygen-independent coproporphyrinogen III oxidase